MSTIAFAACGDSASSTATDVSEVAAPDGAGPDASGDVAETTPDASAPSDVTAPSDTTDSTGTEVSAEVRDDTAGDTVEPIDPDALGFVPGPWTAFRLPEGARFEVLSVALAQPDAPAAEDTLGFVAKVRTDATSLTTVTEQGEDERPIGARAGTRDLLLGFSPSGELVEVSPGNPIETELELSAPPTGAPAHRCAPGPRAELAAARNSVGVSADGSALEVTPLASDRPRQIYNGEKERPYIPIAKRSKSGCATGGVCAAPGFGGFISTEDGREYALVTTDGGLSVTWLNGVEYVHELATGSAFVRIDQDPTPGSGSSGPSNVASFVKLIADAEVLAVLGGPSDDLMVLLDRPASGGESARVTLERLDLGSGRAPLEPPVWVCKDACLRQVSPSFWCGTSKHFRPTGSGGTTVLTGVFSGTVEFGSGVTLSTGGSAGGSSGGSSGSDTESFVLVLDENGNPRIGRKGGGMSIDRVAFSPEGDIVLAGTFAGEAGLGLEASAVGERDVWFGVFSKDTLAPQRSATYGKPGLESKLASDWLALERAGECEASGAIGGFAVRLEGDEGGDLIDIVGVGENAKSCVSDVVIPGGGGETRIVGHGGGTFYWLPGGSSIMYDEYNGLPGPPTNMWPPIITWRDMAGYSRARIARNSR